MSQISRRTLIKASAATAAAAAAVAAPGAASAEMMESPKEHPGYPAAKESAARVRPSSRRIRFRNQIFLLRVHLISGRPS